MKATIHTIEAVLGVLIVLLGMTLIYPVREREEIQLTSIGRNCLKSLDQEGILKYYVSNDMSSSLNNSLRGCLPQITDFTFKVCDSVNCNADFIPENKAIFVSSYIVSGYEGYEAKLVNLWLWLK